MSNGTTRIAAARVKNNENILIEAFRLARRSMLCQALCTVKTKTRQQNDFFYIFLPLVPHNKARKSPKQVLPNTYICVGPPHQLHKKQGF